MPKRFSANDRVIWCDWRDLVIHHGTLPKPGQGTLEVIDDKGLPYYIDRSNLFHDNDEAYHYLHAMRTAIKVEREVEEKADAARYAVRLEYMGIIDDVKKLADEARTWLRYEDR